MKQSTRSIGRQGETLAAEYLQQQGYEILQRNYRWAHGEIDIIASKHDTLIFVEVKAAQQAEFGSPASWVDERKQKQIGKAAQHYLFEHEIQNVDCRFDVIALTAVRGEWQIEHIESAFWL